MSRKLKIAGIAILIIGALIFFFKADLQECEDKACIIAAGEQCNYAVLDLQEDIGRIQYNTYTDCSFMKTIVSLDEPNPEMKNLLDGTFTICDYNSGAFNEQWVHSLVDGIEDCTDVRGEPKGNLKEIIGQLLLFA
jgi:hypothetical protein